MKGDKVGNESNGLLSLFGFLETKYTQNNLLPFRSHIKVKAKLSSPLLS